MSEYRYATYQVKGLAVYVAGAFSAESTLAIGRNIHRGISKAVEVLKQEGMIPYCPWLDFLFSVVTGTVIESEEIYEYSMDWLRRCDALLVVEGWEESAGTKVEIGEAVSLGKPVFYDIDRLLVWKTLLDCEDDIRGLTGAAGMTHRLRLKDKGE